ncbi:MAG: hypothetical protein ACSLFN_03210 [Candidatus Limnocylindrales bacterium]
MSPRLATGLLALVVAVGLLVAPTQLGPVGPTVVRAARPDLTMTSTARYDVQPDRQRIRVTLDLTLTNHLKDTKTTAYYFDYALFDVMAGTSGFKATGDGANPTVRVVKRADRYTRLRLTFPRLRSGKSATYRLVFNLNDPGGAATRDLRVGDSLVSFPVWAFATDSTPGSEVTVVFPAGYEVEVEAGEIASPTTDADGRTVFRTGSLEAPLDFFAYLVADRPGSYVEQTINPMVGATSAPIVVRSWPDDAPWGKRVADLLGRGLPRLGERIGVPWPHEDPLVVQEAVSRSTGGYAGLFVPRSGTVEIAYYAADFVVLHEAAHSWFNGSLLADRWANEAFASYYATEVAADLKVKGGPEELTDELLAARIPLNAWGPVGTEDVAQEDYAYAASLALARLIAERAGDEALANVWSAAAERVGAYQPTAGEPELVTAPPDWRGLLDLLESGSAGPSYVDLWRDWVARPTDLPLLDARAVARQRLAAVESATDGWRLPRPIRDAMRAWRFEDATALIDGAEASLAARADVEAAAAKAGVIAPDTLRTAFEDDDGFDDALAEAEAELGAIKDYARAAAARPAEVTPFLSLGLWGETPEVDLKTASAALARGDLEVAVAAAGDAELVWTTAESIGHGRAVSLGLLALATLLAVALIIGSWRRRHRRRHRTPMAWPLRTE